MHFVTLKGMFFEIIKKHNKKLKSQKAGREDREIKLTKHDKRRHFFGFDSQFHHTHGGKRFGKRGEWILFEE